jgi:predicted dehydrogenase
VPTRAQDQDVLRWGALGSSRYVVEHILPAITKTRNSLLLAVASRDIERARRTAEVLGTPRAYGSYEELISDPDIDVVYNALPNHLHAEWSLRALSAGKHVLCEKPLAPNASEARRFVEDAAGMTPFLFEGYMWRFHTQWNDVFRLIHEGIIGEITLVSSHYSYFDRNPDSSRNDPSRGGGALLMIGCYPIILARALFDQMPTRITGQIEIDPEFYVDRLAGGALQFPTGVGMVSAGTQMAEDQWAVIYGTQGAIRIPKPINPAPDKPATIFVESRTGRRALTTAPADQFASQATHVSDAILRGSRPSLRLGLETIEIIDAIKDSARTGKAVVFSA